MNTYEQIAKIANDLDSLGLIKEANTVDEVLETLVNIKNVKVAGKNQSIISKKIDIFFKLCSINPINKEMIYGFQNYLNKEPLTIFNMIPSKLG